jgi:hypothetical protein
MRPAQGGASSDSESEPDHPPHDEDEDSNNMIYTTKQQQPAGQGHGSTAGTAAFRSRFLPRHSKGITTTPGQHGAGETETEADEPVRIRYRLHVS